MSARNQIRNAVIACVTTIMLSSYFAYAVAPPVVVSDGDVIFRAVENNSLLLDEVEWEIISLEDQSVKTDKRHTFTTKLPPGHYIAKLTCKGKRFKREFEIATPFHKVVIDCAA